MLRLFHQFFGQDIVSYKPVRTNTILHVVYTCDAVSFPLPPTGFQNPGSVKVKKEIKTMLELGVNTSMCQWASLITAVGKNYGSVRVCIDYRKLNAVTVEDPNQMLWVDYLTNNLG